MNNNFSKLSQGCKLCQQGKWLCIFITYKCTAGCDFCPAPFTDDKIHSGFGDNKEQILEYLKKNEFDGISFSGGDPFLVYDRMLEWLKYFKKHLPHYYYWVYTNGLAVNETKLKTLANNGMDEIRFNIAATNYLSLKVWEQIKLARKHFSHVAIEIPSIKNDFEKLCEALKKANEIGIDYLNLHDYIISEKEMHQTSGRVNNFLLNKTTILKYAESSIGNTFEVKKHSKSNRFNFGINHCSMQQKEEQMLQRRLKMGAIFNDPLYDFELDEGLICNFYRFPYWFKDITIKQVLLEANKKIESYKLLKSELKNWMDKPMIKLVQANYIPCMEVNGEKMLVDWRVIN